MCVTYKVVDSVIISNVIIISNAACGNNQWEYIFIISTPQRFKSIITNYVNDNVFKLHGLFIRCICESFMKLWCSIHTTIVSFEIDCTGVAHV